MQLCSITFTHLFGEDCRPQNLAVAVGRADLGSSTPATVWTRLRAATSMVWCWVLWGGRPRMECVGWERCHPSGAGNQERCASLD